MPSYRLPEDKSLQDVDEDELHIGNSCTVVCIRSLRASASTPHVSNMVIRPRSRSEEASGSCIMGECTAREYLIPFSVSTIDITESTCSNSRLHQGHTSLRARAPILDSTESTCSNCRLHQGHTSLRARAPILDSTKSTCSNSFRFAGTEFLLKILKLGKKLVSGSDDTCYTATLAGADGCSEERAAFSCLHKQCSTTTAAAAGLWTLLAIGLAYLRELLYHVARTACVISWHGARPIPRNPLGDFWNNIY
ncbi:hypothetical protein J6590_015695 [Homalodisca vitripennis]|nr:hypothetical protein J6590_015695 [Homalodisca vitripennis]